MSRAVHSKFVLLLQLVTSCPLAQTVEQCINQPLLMSLATQGQQQPPSPSAPIPFSLQRASGFIGIHCQGHLHTRVCYILILITIDSIDHSHCSPQSSQPASFRGSSSQVYGKVLGGDQSTQYLSIRAALAPTTFNALTVSSTLGEKNCITL